MEVNHWCIGWKLAGWGRQVGSHEVTGGTNISIVAAAPGIIPTAMKGILRPHLECVLSDQLATRTSVILSVNRPKARITAIALMIPRKVFSVTREGSSAESGGR